MTRADYKDLAYILHISKISFKSPKYMRSFVSIICRWLQQDNPRFDEIRFIEAVYNSGVWKDKPEIREKQQKFFEGE